MFRILKHYFPTWPLPCPWSISWNCHWQDIELLYSQRGLLFALEYFSFLKDDLRFRRKTLFPCFPPEQGGNKPGVGLTLYGAHSLSQASFLVLELRRSGLMHPFGNFWRLAWGTEKTFDSQAKRLLSLSSSNRVPDVLYNALRFTTETSIGALYL